MCLWKGFWSFLGNQDIRKIAGIFVNARHCFLQFKYFFIEIYKLSIGRNFIDYGVQASYFSDEHILHYPEFSPNQLS